MTPPPHPDSGSPPSAASGAGADGGRRWWMGAALLAVLALVAYRSFGARDPDAGRGAAAPTAATRPIPVVAVTARQGEMPVYLTGLGSVAASNTVVVKSRVEGQIVRITFEEGQLVHAGDVLAEIDPRPFEVQLTQAEGQMARDLAQLQDARRNLARFRELLGQGVVAKQEYDDRAATVGQLEGAVKLDQGLIDAAKLQLTYAKVTAPISGRAGLRRVDVGNVVHPSDEMGLVVLTQTRPITVTFTMPEDDLPAVLARLRTAQRPPVEAYDRAGTTKLATGTLLTVDNQIDQATGTARLKAEFANDDGALFPNQFVNVRLLLDVRSEAVIVPAAAIQRGPQGTFVYAVTPDRTVEVRPVTVGPTAGTDAAVERGLAAGDVVVVEGVDKLRPGAVVDVKTPATAAAAAPGA